MKFHYHIFPNQNQKETFFVVILSSFSKTNSLSSEGDADLSNTWLSKNTPARGMPGPMTSTAVKRRRGGHDVQSDTGTETPQESEAGSEADFET